jgi:hypothetical protein
MDPYCLVQLFDEATGTVTYRVCEYEQGVTEDVVFTGTREECESRWQAIDYPGWLLTRQKAN